MRKGLKNTLILLLAPLMASCAISGQGSSSPAGSESESSLTDASSTPPSPSKEEAIEELKDSADRFIEGYGFLLLASGEEATAYSTSGEEPTWLFDTPMGDWSEDKYNILTLHTSLEEVIAADPDYIFVTTMGDEQKALDYLNGLIQQNPAWSELSAVKEDRYVVLPKDLFHYKPNNRWGESYQYLGEILYPTLFHEG